ncbi:nuclear transport factor 2 family protein [Streptomyces marincola]|uniref:nuclear transport factor 2 family protein n=1 Tax=Streptomyces marincola TaxID=2878388 RepID=UPI001CF2C3A7|nr:nuclear transport factor 2 family protein [Streptomyces marincola]UCM88169.1 nuclear transport factor 2 family protein [Streptomyces marincola]
MTDELSLPFLGAESTTLSASARRERNVVSLRSYFRLLQERDIESWIELWADDCTVVAPYADGRIPQLLSGRADVYAFYREEADGYARLSFPGTDIMPTQDPDRVVVHWYPRGELTDGTQYQNENIGIFEFDAYGRIRRFTEFFNPLGLTGRPDPAVDGR